MVIYFKKKDIDDIANSLNVTIITVYLFYLGVKDYIVSLCKKPINVYDVDSDD
jgi:hypothetical protein